MSAMPGTDQNLPALITIGVSHYCEKVRWALERFGIPYLEEAHVPGPHRFAAKAAGGCGTVPCLRLPQPGASSSAGSSTEPGQRCIDESTPILRWADSQRAAAAAAAAAAATADEGAQAQQQQQQQQQALLDEQLFPPGEQGAEVERLCQEFDAKLGPAVRVWAYSHLLYTPAIARAMVAPPVPALERLALRCGGWWLLRAFMAKGIGINPERGAKALQRIRQSFDQVAALLADGRPYLTGQSFTAADLTFAALAAPAVGQAYGVAPGLDDSTPAAMREQLEELRAHPAGRFALRLWETQRRVVLQ